MQTTPADRFANYSEWELDRDHREYLFNAARYSKQGNETLAKINRELAEQVRAVLNLRLLSGRR